MPELPEVETVRRLLEPRVSGKTIEDVRVAYWRMVQSDHDAFIPTLRGQTFDHIERIGKFLIFRFQSDLVLISHLRMEGKYISLKQNENDSRYARVVFAFTDGTKLCYDDSRCFGTMKLSSAAAYRAEPPLDSIGPEPFQLRSGKHLYANIHHSSRPIKELLLDQTVMTGLGNIYADEVLYRSQIHPELPGNMVTPAEADRLVSHAKEVLQRAIDAGGSTIRSYQSAPGVDGRFQHALSAYGKAGEPCSRCGAPMAKIKVKGRGSTFCPHCQINRALPLPIVITGHMHAGKSTLLKLAAERGYPTMSADAVVRELYQDPKNVARLAQLLKLEFPNGVLDTAMVTATIIGDRAAKKRLEKWLHPLVKQTILAWIKAQTKSPVFVEVPLYYQAGWHDLSPYVIGVRIPFPIQKERIMAHFRQPDLALALAQTNEFSLHEEKVADLLVNDGYLHDFVERGERALDRALAFSVKAAQAADL